MNSFLHLNGVDKSHGATRALSGVDMAVGPDELLSLCWGQRGLVKRRSCG